MTNSGPGFAKDPNHCVAITYVNRAVSITVDGKEIARSNDAKLLAEASYPPVYYIPLEDIPADLLVANSHQTHCPFKGDASYWDLKTDTGIKKNAVWGYQTPFDEAVTIKDHVAFYADAATITPIE